eukprot:TRINITY_DN393_c0_g3_i1.p3 TRINITY_DN393_c0_g3~~TRINITY_DN393_c0_g3_i1.p3  ORF type:complete len:154 (+),score=75.32 TRINITY_DN393_c0_g3_i1:68-529(+)
MRAMVFMCFAAAVSAGFLDRLTGNSHADDKHPVVKICNAGSDLFQVGANDLEVTPYPPQKGHPMTVSLKGHVKEQLNAINLSVNVHYGFVPLMSKNVNACGELHCPIPAGPFTLTKSVDLPSSMPSGHFSISMKGHNEKNQEVVCASIKVHIE